MKLKTIKLATCHGSTIFSADVIDQPNHTHKSWLNISIMCRLLEVANFTFCNFVQHRLHKYTTADSEDDTYIIFSASNERK